MAQQIALLTSCTMSRNFEPILKIEDAPICVSMNELCLWWAKQTKAKSVPANLKTPGELYAGIAFDTITEIAQDIGHGNIFVVTGGVGLVGLNDKILPYDFTSDKGASANAPQRVSGEKFIPHIWWGKVNEALHSNSTPVASVVEKHDVIVGALPKAFIKYIIRDLESVSPAVLREKVFLLLPRSMMGSVPKTIHNAFVPYGPSYVQDLTANRYDKAQRVARKFITEGAENYIEYADTVSTRGSADAMQETEIVDYDKMFEEHPRLLDGGDIGIAIHRAKALGLKIGGRHRFAGAWRGAKGQLKVNVTATIMTKAKKGLKTILSGGAMGAYTDNEQLLERLGIFVQAVREEAPELIFTSKEVTAWGKETYADDKDLCSAAKVSYVLSYHAKYLGLEMLTIGSTNGYRVSK